MSLQSRYRKDPDELLQYKGNTTIELDDDDDPVIVRPYGGVIALTDELDPWERQPVECDKDWILFKIYRDLPLDIRSFNEAYKQYAEANPRIHYNPDTYNYPPEWYCIITKVHKWKVRAEAFDRHMDERDIQLMSRQRLEAIKAAAYLGKAMRDKALDALVYLRAVIYKEVIQADGSTETVLVSNLSPNAIVQLAKVGVELEKAALGIGRSTSGRPNISVNVALGIQVQGTVSDIDLVTRATKIIDAKKVSALSAPATDLPAYAEVVEVTIPPQPPALPLLPPALPRPEPEPKHAGTN